VLKFGLSIGVDRGVVDNKMDGEANHLDPDIFMR
jgi:hypothetical protein